VQFAGYLDADTRSPNIIEASEARQSALEAFCVRLLPRNVALLKSCSWRAESIYKVPSTKTFQAAGKERRPTLEVHFPCRYAEQADMDEDLRIVASADEAAKAAAAEALYRYNIVATGVDDRVPIGAVLSDGSGNALGGLWGRTELGLLFLDMFFVPAHLRGRSYGARLLAAVEEAARRRGCRRAVVETSSFQAPGFYVRHGYAEFGRIPFAIDGQARVFLHKQLAWLVSAH